MRRLLAVLTLVLVLGACSDDDEPVAGPTTSTTATPGEPPAWIATVTDAAVVEGETFEGVVLWVDEADRTVYVEDCDLARRATAEGGPYGPTDGPGFAYICR
jgi:hypothetical protein